MAENNVSLRTKYCCMAQGGAAVELGRGEEGPIEVSLWAASDLLKQIEVIPPAVVYLKEAMGTAQAVRTSLSIGAVIN